MLSLSLTLKKSCHKGVKKTTLNAPALFAFGKYKLLHFLSSPRHFIYLFYPFSDEGGKIPTADATRVVTLEFSLHTHSSARRYMCACVCGQVMQYRAEGGIISCWILRAASMAQLFEACVCASAGWWHGQIVKTYNARIWGKHMCLGPQNLCELDDNVTGAAITRPGFVHNVLLYDSLSAHLYCVVQRCGNCMCDTTSKLSHWLC